MKRIFSLIISFMMLASVTALTPEAFAGEIEASAGGAQASKNASREVSASASQVNPLYEDVLDESDLVKPAESSASGSAQAPQLNSSGSTSYNTTVSAAGKALRDKMVARQGTVTINYRSTKYSDAWAEALMEDIFDQALIHTGAANMGDYLMWQYGGWHALLSGKVTGSYYYLTITYTITYYTTAAQEAAVTTEVNNVLAGLGVSGMTGEYEKVKAIYDYICSNVTYDETSTGTLKHTAYAALINKTAVCQGYALLFYRMALASGIDTRLIAGVSGGEGHGWNIVEIGNRYYNLDSTWDAEIKQAGYSYQYFLKNNANFKDHTRDVEYRTEAFHNKYMMAPADYTLGKVYGAKDISAMSAALSYTQTTWTGKAKKPAASIPGLTSSDFSVTYANNIKVGKAAVTITGKGDYAGTIARSFVIVPNAPSSVKITLYGSNGYDDIYAYWTKPTANKTTTVKINYQVQYKKKGGKWVTYKNVSGTSASKKNFADGAQYAFRVKPYVTIGGKKYYGTTKTSGYLYTLKKLSKPTVKKASANYIKVSWKNIPGESGYQIFRSKYKNKGFKNAGTVNYKYKSAKIKTPKYTTYYYKIRAYKNVKVKGKSYRVYGPWSTVRAYKLK